MQTPPPLRSGQGAQNFFAYISEHFKTKTFNEEKKIEKVFENCSKVEIKFKKKFRPIKKKIAYVSDTISRQKK